MSNAVHLACAAQIVRRKMFREAKPFNGFPERCQEESVPSLLLGLVSMILEGPSIKDQMEDNPCSTCSCPNIEVQQHQAQADTWHIISQHQAKHFTGDTSSTYRGMMLLAHTRTRALIDRLSYLGISLSYDRVLQLSTQMEKSVCQQFHREQVIFPPTMCGKVFTTATIDNIDHNPSSTTAKESFHGTGISLLQHPSFAGEGVDRSTVFVEGSVDASFQNIGHLPHYYTDVPPVTTSIKHSTVPATRLTSLVGENFKKKSAEEYLWLGNAKKVLTDITLPPDNASWAAFHASRQSQEGRVICPTALHLLFLDSAHTEAMIQHTIDVATKSVNHLNPGQIPVVTLATVFLSPTNSVDVARELW